MSTLTVIQLAHLVAAADLGVYTKWDDAQVAAIHAAKQILGDTLIRIDRDIDTASIIGAQQVAS